MSTEIIFLAQCYAFERGDEDLDKREIVAESRGRARQSKIELCSIKSYDYKVFTKRQSFGRTIPRLMAHSK